MKARKDNQGSIRILLPLILAILLTGETFSAPSISGTASASGIYGTAQGVAGSVTGAVSGIGQQISSVTGQVSGAVNSITAPITGAVNSITAPINGAIGQVTGALGSLGGIASSITGFTSSIQGVLAQISSITGLFSSIFDSFNLDSVFDQVNGNNNLLACVAGGMGLDTKSLVGKFGFDIKGICSLAGLKGKGGSGFNLGSIANCLGMGGNLGSSLSSLCSGMESGAGGSGTSGGESGTGGMGDAGAAGGEAGAGGGNLGGVLEYSANNIAVIESSVSDEFVINKGDEETVVKPEEQEFKGISGEELWKKDGGYINKKTKESPGSSTASANLNFDVPTLVLKEKALQLTGSDRIDKVGLPATKADVLERENRVAQTVSDGMVDLHLEGDSFAIRLREKFLDIKSDSLSDYYSKEAQKFKEIREDDETLNALYTVAKKTIGVIYGDKLFALTRERDYVFDPSMSRAAMIDPKYRARYIFASLHEVEKETAVKSAMALEMKKQKILLDIMAQRAYISASIFRSDIAKKEIDDMLKAIDQTIK